MSYDLIRDRLSRPIDWKHFEQIVSEILAQDDFPTLKQLGGIADGGADAVDESFYEDSVQTNAVIQITSDRAQTDKFKRTVKRLSETRTSFTKLVVVYRHPVETGVRNDIVAAGTKAGILVDVRDEMYLIRELAKPGNAVFARHFGTKEEQIEMFLKKADPLGEADSRLRRAVLATVSAFAINPAAKEARITFFDRAILAALVASGTGVTLSQLSAMLADLFPDEQIPVDAISTALNRMLSQGLCATAADKFAASDEALLAIGGTIAAIEAASASIHRAMLDTVSQVHKMDDASKGHMERNLRRSLMALFRRIGPTVDLKADLASEVDHSPRDIRELMSLDLAPDIARTAVLALNEFVRNPSHTEILARFARSYAALALRNADPLGRSFQKDVLSRSEVLLDTDAVLALIIEELPEHRMLVEALRALQSEGVHIVIPKQMVTEAELHISRAYISYVRTAGSLERIPVEEVTSAVWHAVVRGYYYYRRAGGADGFNAYWSRYRDREQPFEFLVFILQRILKSVTILDDVPLRDSDEASYHALLPLLLKQKEQRRRKATYRDDAQKEERTKEDIKCALYVAQRSVGNDSRAAKGYLVSADSAFGYMQRLPEWGNRTKVLLHTESVAQFAELACGIRLHDDDLVRLVFNPVHVAAAETLTDEIQALAKAGVDLRGVSLYKVEWTLTAGLRDSVLTYRQADTDADATMETKLGAAVALSSRAQAMGYELDLGMIEVMNEYRTLTLEFGKLKERNAKLVDVVEKVTSASFGQSKKGRRRARKLLREIGGILPAEGEQVDVDDDESQANEMGSGQTPVG